MDSYSDRALFSVLLPNIFLVFYAFVVVVWLVGWFLFFISRMSFFLDPWFQYFLDLSFLGKKKKKSKYSFKLLFSFIFNEAMELKI